MSSNKIPFKWGTFGLAGLGVAIGAAFGAAAQNETPGQTLGSATLSFGIEAGDENKLTTGFDLNYDNQTRDQRLTFNANLDIAAPFDDPSNTEVDAPQVALSYNRDNGATNITFAADYARRDVSGLVPLGDPGSSIELTDFIVDPGKRQDVGAALTLEIGQNDPFGAVLQFDYEKTSYIDTVSPDLNDEETRTLNLGFNLRVDSTSTIRPEYSISRSETDNAVNLSQRIERFGVGVEMAVTPTVDLDAGIGQADVSSISDDGFGGRTELGNQQFEANIDLTLAQPNGSLSFSYARTAEIVGATDSLTASRNLGLADGSDLSFSIGVASMPSGATTGLASLEYERTLRNGSYALGVQREISVSTEGEEAVVDRASGSFAMDLSPNSEFSLAGNWTSFDLVDPATADTDRSDLTLQYNRELTPDWTFSAGATHRQSRQTGAALTTEDTLFVFLSRSIAIPR